MRRLYSISLILLFSITQLIALNSEVECRFKLVDVYWSTPFNLGSNNTLNVILKYVGREPAENLAAYLNITSISENKSEGVVIEDRYNLTEVWFGEEVNLEFNFPVKEKLKLSYYELPLKINYSISGEVFEEFFEINVSIRGRPKISIECLAGKLYKGEFNEIPLRLLNNGTGVAREISLMISITEPRVDLVGKNVFEFSEVNIGGEVNISTKVFIDNQAPKVFQLNLRIEYFDQFGNYYIDAFSIGLVTEELGKPELEIISVTETLLPGRINEIRFNLTNVGRGVARNITVSIGPQSASMTIIGDSSFDLKSLRPNESKIISIRSYLEEEVYGSVEMGVTVKYVDERGSSYRSSEKIGFYVEKIKRPEIEIKRITEELDAGEVNEVRFTLTNIGSDLARNLSISLGPQSPYITILGDSSVELQDLSPNSTINVKFKIYLDVEAKGSIEIMVTASYRDALDNEHSVSEKLGFYVKPVPRPRIKVEPLINNLRPGEVNEISIKVANLGENEALDIVLDFYSSEELTVVGSSRLLIESLSGGASKELKLLIHVPEKTIGSKEISVRISYRDVFGRSFEDFSEIGFTVMKFNKPRIEVEVLNDTLNVDRVNNIVIKLVNVGNASALNITVNAFSNTEVMSIIGFSSFYRDELASGDEWIIHLKSFLQPKVYGAIQALLTLSYWDELNNYYRVTSTVGFMVKGLPEIDVSSFGFQPSLILPGDRRVKVFIAIVNVGEYLAENISVKLLGIPGLVHESFPGACEATVPILSKASISKLTFQIDVDEDADSGRYEIPLMIKTDSTWRNKTIPITINEKVRFKVERISFNAKPYPGARGLKMQIFFRNPTNTTAKQVKLTIISTYMTGVTMSVIGDIPSNSSRVIVLEVDVDSSTPVGKIPVELEFTWMQDGREVSQTIGKEIEIFEPKSKIEEVRSMIYPLIKLTLFNHFFVYAITLLAIALGIKLGLRED